MFRPSTCSSDRPKLVTATSPTTHNASLDEVASASACGSVNVASMPAAQPLRNSTASASLEKWGSAISFSLKRSSRPFKEDGGMRRAANDVDVIRDVSKDVGEEDKEWMSTLSSISTISSS